MALIKHKISESYLAKDIMKIKEKEVVADDSFFFYVLAAELKINNGAK